MWKVKFLWEQVMTSLKLVYTVCKHTLQVCICQHLMLNLSICGQKVKIYNLRGNLGSLFVWQVWMLRLVHLHGGGLSSSVVAQQGGDVSLVERQIEVVYGVPPPVGFCQAVKGHAHWHCRELAVLVCGENSIS